MSPTLFALAYAGDWLIGDPSWLPHPVRWMGRLIKVGESWLRRIARTASGELVAGSVLTLVLVGLFGFGSWWLLHWLTGAQRTLGLIVSLYLAVTTLATRSLLAETTAVLRHLASGNLDGARKQVARIVGRDTDDLDEGEVTRAGIETLAESAADGIVSPMFFLAIGGVPAALAFKSISTLDSMIGHHGDRYEYFGKCAARLDDAANFVPARLTALLIVLSAWTLHLDWRNACRVLWRDGAKHASPNAGRPEAAMAGALGVQLGGTNIYDGEPHHGEFLGDAHQALDSRALADALRLTRCVSLLMFALSWSALLLITRRWWL